MTAPHVETLLDEALSAAVEDDDSLPPTQEEGKTPDFALGARKEEAKKDRESRLAIMPTVPAPPTFSTPNRSPNRAQTKPRSQAQHTESHKAVGATLPPNAPEGQRG